jgi:hypothetical protein
MTNYNVDFLLKVFNREYKHNPSYLKDFEIYNKQKDNLYTHHLKQLNNNKLVTLDSIHETDTILQAKNKKHNITIERPTYIDLHQAFRDISNEYQTYMKQYEYEKHRVLQNESATNLINLTEHMNKLKQVLAIINSIQLESKNKERIAYVSTYENYIKKKNQLEHLYDNIKEHDYNDIDSNKYIHEYINQKQLLDEYRNTPNFKETVSNAINKFKTDYHTESINSYLYETSNKYVEMEKKIENKTKKLEKAISKKIKDKLKKKDLTNFTDKTECLSNKTSKPFYMSKSDLVKQIQKDPILNKRIGSLNVKSLSKNKLCNIIFEA